MAGGYSVTIRAEDGATAVINRINASLSRMTAPVSRLNAATKTLADRTGLTRLTTGFEQAAQGALSLGNRISGVLPMFGALTGAASLAGMARLVTTWSRFGEEIGRASDRLGISARSLGQWQTGARLAGASMLGMTQGLTSLRDTLTDAVGGRNNEAVQYLNILGVRFRDARGNARDFEEVLPELAERIKNLRDPTLQARVATVFFGGATAELLPILRQGADGIRRMRQEGEATSRTTDEQVARARALGHAWRGLETGATQAGNALASALAPALTPLLERLSAWVQASDGLAGWIDRLSTKIDDWVARGGPKELGDQIASIAETVDRVVTAFGGWETAIVGLGAAMTLNLLGPLGTAARALVTLAGVQIPAWLLRLLGAGGLGAVGAVALAMTPSPAGETQSDRDLLERLRQDPEAAQREMAGDAPVRAPVAPTAAGWISNLWRTRIMGTQPQTGVYGTPPPATPGDPSAPRGLRNNNPLNLMHHPAQVGLDPARPSDGRFGRYNTMEEGYASAIRQMRLNASRGNDTLARQIAVWAPPNENNTAAYIARVAREAGMSPNDRLDLNDRGRLATVLSTMTAIENGRSVDRSVIDRGIGLALGPGEGGAAPVTPVPAGDGPAGGASGRVAVDVTLRGAPPGTTVMASASGAAQAAPPRVERALPSMAAP